MYLPLPLYSTYYPATYVSHSCDPPLNLPGMEKSAGPIVTVPQVPYNSKGAVSTKGSLTHSRAHTSAGGFDSDSNLCVGGISLINSQGWSLWLWFPPKIAHWHLREQQQQHRVRVCCRRGSLAEGREGMRGAEGFFHLLPTRKIAITLCKIVRETHLI